MEQLKKNRKIIFVVLGVICSLILVLLFALIFTKKSTKSGEEVEQILSYNEYGVYYTYGGNTYDKDGTCYDYNDEEETCEREIDIWDSVLFYIKDTNNPEYQFSIFITLDEQGRIVKKRLEYEHKEKDSVISDYSYVSNDTHTESYLVHYDDKKFCYVVEKAKDLKTDQIEYCTKTPAEKLKDFKEDYQKTLEKLGVTEDDIYHYVDWYYEKYISKKRKEALETSKNNSLSYEEAQELLEKENYQVESIDGGVRIYYTIEIGGTIYDYKIFNFLFENETLDRVLFASHQYQDMYVYYDIEQDTYFGLDPDHTYEYIIKSANEELNETDAMGICPEEKKKEYRSLELQYRTALSLLKMTEEELMNFATEFYKKEK